MVAPAVPPFAWTARLASAAAAGMQPDVPSWVAAPVKAALLRRPSDAGASGAWARSTCPRAADGCGADAVLRAVVHAVALEADGELEAGAAPRGRPLAVLRGRRARFPIVAAVSVIGVGTPCAHSPSPFPPASTWLTHGQRGGRGRGRAGRGRGAALRGHAGGAGAAAGRRLCTAQHRRRRSRRRRHGRPARPLGPAAAPQLCAGTPLPRPSPSVRAG
jgi:hypothetical protein